MSENERETWWNAEVTITIPFDTKEEAKAFLDAHIDHFADAAHAVTDEECRETVWANVVEATE